jgi:hypothetical protein
MKFVDIGARGSVSNEKLPSDLGEVSSRSTCVCSGEIVVVSWDGAKAFVVVNVEGSVYIEVVPNAEGDVEAVVLLAVL